MDPVTHFYRNAWVKLWCMCSVRLFALVAVANLCVGASIVALFYVADYRDQVLTLGAIALASILGVLFSGQARVDFLAGFQILQTMHRTGNALRSAEPDPWFESAFAGMCYAYAAICMLNCGLLLFVLGVNDSPL